MAHITDLPEEVITCIGEFLNKRDMVTIVRTCRSLQQSLSHLIYKDITLQTGKLPLDVQYLKDNADSVQRLHNFGTIPPEFYRIVFPALHSLEIHFKGANPTRHHQGSALQEINNTALIRLNPTIQDLRINLASHNPSNEFWVAISTSLRQPRILQLTGVFDLLSRAENSFWGTCARFEEISCFGRDGLLSDLAPPMTFPRLDRISLGLNTAFTNIRDTLVYLDWLKRCPNLTKIRWEISESDFPIAQFAQALEQTTWRQLQDLCLTGIVEPDEQLATVIRQLPPLGRLQMVTGTFGPQCFDWLRIRLFGTIRVLHLRECVKLTSRMVLEILHQCVHLEDLEAFHVAFSDLRANPQPWACRGLRRLRLYFDNDSQDDDDAEVDFSETVFRQLSRLEQLEDLEVDEDFMWEYSAGLMVELKKKGPILWRLDSGLGLLINLRRLRTVRVEKTFTSARLEDVVWMLRHWPRLRELTGQFTQDRDDWGAIIGLFKARSIENHNVQYILGAIGTEAVF
ncbi:hypothetical protein BGX23_006359 [Mortierella sp. AD031]|nr:hypothetical protein BGX23_006359 [Mortierella sp. AD031]